MRVARGGAGRHRPGRLEGQRGQSLARRLWPRPGEDWLLSADRNFFNRAGWCAAAGTGTARLRRVKAGLPLPVLELPRTAPAAPS